MAFFADEFAVPYQMAPIPAMQPHSLPDQDLHDSRNSAFLRPAAHSLITPAPPFVAAPMLAAPINGAMLATTGYEVRDENSSFVQGSVDRSIALVTQSTTTIGGVPFIDAAEFAKPGTYGVIKIMNIPFNVTRQEIVHFLGRSPGVIETATMGCAVHIIMERSTSKTMDCFVEFQTVQAAADQVRRQENLAMSGRIPRLGTRHVIVEMSTQDALLADMFPRAKRLLWQNGYPRVMTNFDPYSSGFSGFFTKEEMTGLVRHAEYPQRSPFSVKCLQRTYECMISTLYKFPWYSTTDYTLGDRNLLFQTYITQLSILVEKVSTVDIVGLDQKLLMEFVFAGLNCAGFGERQKFQIVISAGPCGRGINISSLARVWPFDLMSRKVGVCDDVVLLYLHVIQRGYELSPHSHDVIAKNFLTSQASSIGYFDMGQFPLNNTLFQFDASSHGLSYAAAMQMEERLMADLLVAGYSSIIDQHNGTPLLQLPLPFQRLVADVDNLVKKQKDEMKVETTEHNANLFVTTPANSSQEQSVSGSNSSDDRSPTDVSVRSAPDPFRSTRRSGSTDDSIKPSSKPSEPLSKSFSDLNSSSIFNNNASISANTGSSFGAPGSGPVPESPNPASRFSPRTFASPGKGKGKVRMSIDHTIHEHEDEDLYRHD